MKTRMKKRKGKKKEKEKEERERKRQANAISEMDADGCWIGNRLSLGPFFLSPFMPQKGVTNVTQARTARNTHVKGR